MIRFIKDDLFNGPLKYYLYISIAIFIIGIDWSLPPDRIAASLVVATLMFIPLAFFISTLHQLIRFILHITCDSLRK